MLAIAVSPVNPKPEILRILIDAGAEVNAETLFHGSLLNAAIATLGEDIEPQDHTAIAEMLVDAGADVNAEANAANSLLQLATMYGNSEVVGILADAGTRN